MSQNPLLAGIRVLDLSRLLPGPFCTLYFAQLGAEIVKIEEPNGGDYARSLSADLFALVNRGKKSVALDLRRAEEADAFRRLVKDADVVIESFRPGVMDRLGCGYDALRTINPKLVYAALTGYGQTGPYRDRAGHDMNYLAYAGVLDQIGQADGPPVSANVQIADLAGGALTCAVAVLAAVIGARASGQGTYVDVSMLDGTMALTALSAAAIRTIGHAMPRGRDMLSGGLPNYRIYEAADGKHIACGALELKFFANFCKALSRPDLLTLPMSPGPSGEPLRRALAALFKTRTRDEWEAALADADCCVCGIYTPDEAQQNPQVRERGFWSKVDGKLEFTFPVRYSNATTRGGAVPPLGADTESVLSNP